MAQQVNLYNWTDTIQGVAIEDGLSGLANRVLVVKLDESGLELAESITVLDLSASTIEAGTSLVVNGSGPFNSLEVDGTSFTVVVNADFSGETTFSGAVVGAGSTWSGDVGIGGATPQSRLTLKDNGYRQGLNFERLGSSTQRAFQYIGDGTNGTTTDELYTDLLNTNWNVRAGAMGNTLVGKFKNDGTLEAPVITSTTIMNADGGFSASGAVIQTTTDSGGKLSFFSGPTRGKQSITETSADPAVTELQNILINFNLASDDR